jgi:PKD repeat protein
MVSAIQNVVINTSPQAITTSPKDFGIPGDKITFTNESLGGSSYHWLLNGDSVSDDPSNETFTFSEPGLYDVSLVATNDLGCNDTTTTEVFIAVPVVDLSIGQFEVVSDQNTGTIFLEVQNNSNLPIDTIDVIIELDNSLSVFNKIASLIDVGESSLLSLDVGVRLDGSSGNYLCATLNSQYLGFDDVNPIDNEKCLTIEPEIVVEAPFPNPVRDEVRIKLIAPSSGDVKISLLNSAGKVEMISTQAAQEGLNNLFINLLDLSTGIYFIQIEIAGSTSVQRILKL